MRSRADCGSERPAYRPWCRDFEIVRSAARPRIPCAARLSRSACRLPSERCAAIDGDPVVRFRNAWLTFGVTDGRPEMAPLRICGTLLLRICGTPLLMRGVTGVLVTRGV